MSRMQIDEVAEARRKLLALEKLYIQTKKAEKEIKSQVTDYNNQIKQLMIDNELTECGKLKLSATKKEEFNEPQAIEILRQNLSEEDFNLVVKTKEYIDDDALEKLAYNSSFDMSILSPCRVLKGIVYTLKVGK